MAREFIKFSNDKKGFRMLLVVEVLIAAWSLAATFYAVNTGRKQTVVYGAITMLAAFYILGRSFRNYRKIVRQEQEKEGQSEEQSK